MIRVESNDKKNLITHTAVFAVGLLFIYLTSRAEQMTSDIQAAYLLGLMLAGLGGFCLVYQQSYVTTVDPIQKLLTHAGRNTFFGTSRRVVPFSEIACFAVYFLGDYDSQSFHLKIVLKNKEELQTGKWSFDEEEIKGLAQKMAQLVQCDHPAVPLKTNIAREIENALYAAFVVLGFYIFYYGMQVGPLNPGMWFGTLPGFFIVFGWLSCYQIIRRLRKQYSK